MITRITQQERLNFLLTNRLPRRWLTLFMGWLSRLEQPWLCRICIAIWGLFTELDLSDARKTRFRSLQEFFTRQLKEGARRIDSDPDIVVSPCDGIVGAMGQVRQGSALQAKGFPYTLLDLLGDEALVSNYPLAALAPWDWLAPTPFLAQGQGGLQFRICTGFVFAFARNLVARGYPRCCLAISCSVWRTS